MKFCFIVINYNGINYLPKYLNKIRNECEKLNIKLIITDDNSSDNSLNYLNENGYEVTSNKSSKHGFAANVNNGLKYAATLDNYDFFIISNNDIEFLENFLSCYTKFINEFSSINNKIGIYGVKEINPIDINEFSNFIIPNFNKLEHKKVNEVPGFFFAINSELIKKIGLLDEDYFMYGEDNDYFHKTITNNYRIIQVNLPVLHYSEGSSFESKSTSWYAYRNSLLFAQKNLNLLETIKLFLSILNHIYNPFLKNNSPSSIRLRRNGFIQNNFMLIKSVAWNLKFYIKQKNIFK